MYDTKLDKIETTLFIDLETVPMEENITEDDLRNKISKAVSNKETIRKKLEEDRQDLIAKVVKERSIDRYQCKIVCLAYSFDGEDVQAITGKHDEILKIFNNVLVEKKNELGSLISKVRFVGHNSDKFDLPILYLGACKNDLTTLRDVLFYGRKDSADTMKMGSYWLYNEYVSLKNLCRYFGRDTKEDIDGSKVYEYYKAGRIDEIANYCCKDVEDVIFLYRKLSVYDFKRED